MDLRLSTKTEYGLKALMEIAFQGTSKPVQVSDISRRQQIPRESLAILMVELKRAGLVNSVRGPSGGYYLTREPSQISLKEIIEALEGQQEDQLLRNRSLQGAGFTIQDTWSRCLRIFFDALDETPLSALIEEHPAHMMSLQNVRNDINTPIPDGYTYNI